MLSSDLIDVIIGVVFAWFLLSLIVSAVNESFTWATKARSKLLWRALGQMFDNGVKAADARLRTIVVELPRGTEDVRPMATTAPSQLAKKDRPPEITTPAAISEGLDEGRQGRQGPERRLLSAVAPRPLRDQPQQRRDREEPVEDLDDDRAPRIDQRRFGKRDVDRRLADLRRDGRRPARGRVGAEREQSEPEAPEDRLEEAGSTRAFFPGRREPGPF